MEKEGGVGECWVGGLLTSDKRRVHYGSVILKSADGHTLSHACCSPRGAHLPFRVLWQEGEARPESKDLTTPYTTSLDRLWFSIPKSVIKIFVA